MDVFLTYCEHSLPPLVLQTGVIDVFLCIRICVCADMSMLGRAILLTGLPSTCGLFVFNYIFMQQRRRNTLFEYVSITLTRLVISPAAYIMELFFYGIGTSSCPSRVAIFPCCWTDFIK